MDVGQRYWAFLSYSHSDANWAGWLHRALETYRVPKRLVGAATAAGPAPEQFKPIFRDREDLAADPDLKERVRQVLGCSAFLIVVCSPAAARSAWVESEIVQFKRLHGGGARVFPVIVAGEPHASDMPGREVEECFPNALRFHLNDDGTVSDIPAEPVAADLRPDRDGRRGALLKLLAGMLGADLDELIRRDAQRRQRSLLAVTAVSVAATVVMGALTAVAITERNEARDQRAKAEGLIEFMLSDLSKRLEPAGQLDALDAVGRKAMAYYAGQDSHDLDADSLGRRARVLHLMGDLREKRGDLPGALAFFQQAATSTGELLARAPNDGQRIFDHAQSVYWVGHVAEHRGQFDEAQAQFETYKSLADRLVALDSRNDAWRAEDAYANLDLGVVMLEQHRADQAAAAFDAAFVILRARAAAAPADPDRQFELAQVHAWLADAELARGRLDAALGHRMTERAIYQAMLTSKPDDNAAAFSQAVNRAKVASILLAQNQAPGALAELNLAAPEIDRLIAAEPDTVDYREEAAAVAILTGRALFRQHDQAGAARAAAQAQALAQALTAKDPTMVDWQGPLLGGARVLQLEIAAGQAASSSEHAVVLAPAVAEATRLSALAASRPYDRDMARLAAEACLLAGDGEAAGGQAPRARAVWSQGLSVITQAQANGPDPLDDDSHAIMLKLQARLGASV